MEQIPTMFHLGPWHDRFVTSFAALHDMTGTVAVVTGGSRGIGRAIVQTLAEAGADVVIASRKLDACEAAAEQVRTSTGRQAVATPVTWAGGATVTGSSPRPWRGRAAWTCS